MALFITSEGGLTMAGYILSIILILVLMAALLFIRKNAGSSGGRNGSGRRSADTRRLTVCAMCVALAAVTSMIKVFELPLGGSVTLCSMLMIVLPGWIYGLSAGLLCGLVYGILQFVLGPYVLTLPQVLFDYVFAFMVMGLSGLFCRMKNGLIPAYIVAVIGRWIMATIAGLIWVSLGMTIVEGWSPVPYSMAYNGSYIGAEAAVALVILMVPSVRRGLERIKAQALCS